MAEKKRFRPSLTAYRALENEVSELKEEIVRHETMRVKYCGLVDDNESLRRKNTTLEKSNDLMAMELDRLREANEQLSKINVQLNSDIQHLQSRGFWKRLFNR